MPPAVENGTSIVLRLFKKLVDDRKKVTADTISEEAVVADVAEIAVRDMSDEFCEEVPCGKGDGLSSIGIMVKIFEDDMLAVVRFDA